MACNLSERGTIDVFILRRMQEECHAKEIKLYMCVVELETPIHRASIKVMEWVIRKKGLP